MTGSQVIHVWLFEVKSTSLSLCVDMKSASCCFLIALTWYQHFAVFDVESTFLSLHIWREINILLFLKWNQHVCPVLFHEICKIIIIILFVKQKIHFCNRKLTWQQINTWWVEAACKSQAFCISYISKTKQTLSTIVQGHVFFCWNWKQHAKIQVFFRRKEFT